MQITAKNLIQFCIYFTVRHCIEHSWLNDRDQYLWPNDDWKNDRDFQTDCLAYTLFSRANNIKSADGVNHLIPFAEAEVNAQDKYASHFLIDYMAGNWKPEKPEEPEQELLELLPIEEQTAAEDGAPIVFSLEAKTVFDRARELWKYYHSQPKADPNASFYDIRAYFQGRNKKGVMNPDSQDVTYTTLLDSFRQAYKALADKIEPKIYQYGFLLK